MPGLLLELLSEEIPARMQEGALDKLRGDLRHALIDTGKFAVDLDQVHGFVTPRRVAATVDGLPPSQPAVSVEVKGPKAGAPEAAIQGFLKKNGLARSDLAERGGVYFATVRTGGQPTAAVLKNIIEKILSEFVWPKSMRWGGHEMRWVRPLQNILCIFGDKVVPVEFGHLKANNYTFGHRFLAPEKIEITDASQYESLLEKAYVIANRAKRRAKIKAEAEKLAASKNLMLQDDPALLDEVTGLVEWPVLLMGGIDAQFMDLPREVLISEMRNHQKYFALTSEEPLPPQVGSGSASLAPHFLITSNLEAGDGGKAVIRGNERVLRARLEDGRFFWDSDRAKPLAEWAKGLGDMIFHAKLGSVADKAGRIAQLSNALAQYVPGADRAKAERAARLCKADLTTGMVGEFPELQGIMGEYYALAQNEDKEVAQAIREHYQPQGPGDALPASPTGIVIALADKLDTLAGMFAANEKPTGSKDPFALRRAALGVIRIILEKRLRLGLLEALEAALKPFLKPETRNLKPSSSHPRPTPPPQAGEGALDDLLAFFADRLKVQLKEDGIRPDVIDAVFASGDGDLVRVTARARAVQAFLETGDGGNLLAAYNRAAGIVAIEEKKDGKYYAGSAESSLLKEPEERDLFDALGIALPGIEGRMQAEAFEAAMTELAGLRAPVDAFFDRVMVNDKDAALRANRLHLLSALRGTMDAVADFSRIRQPGNEKKKAA